MKKFIKALGLFSFLAVLMLTFTSCNSYNFYKDWNGAGADIESNNIFTTITLDEAKEKKDAKETFVLFYGASSSSTAVSMVTSLQAQAEYLNNTDATIYYVNSADYYETSSKRALVREAIGMRDAPSTADPVIMIFRNGASAIDSSMPSIAKNSKFYDKESGQFLYTSLYSYIFKELLVK